MKDFWDFPVDPVVRILHFHCKGHEFDPWSGSWDPISQMSQPKMKKENEILFHKKDHHRLRKLVTKWEKILKERNQQGIKNVEQEMSASKRKILTTLIEKGLKTTYRQEAVEIHLHSKRCSKSLVGREIQINTTENHFTPLSLELIQKLTYTKNWQGCGAPWTLCWLSWWE